MTVSKKHDPIVTLEALIMNARQFRPHELLDFLLDDILADIGIPKRYPPQDAAMPVISQLSRQYAQAVIDSEPYTDILGTLYMELASHGARQHLGQYFTPATVVACLTEMTLMDLNFEDKPDNELISICDPCVGSGRMLLAPAAHVLKKYGAEGLKRISLVGIDLDRTCAKMTTAQLLANAAVHQHEFGEILIYHGNALGPPHDISVIAHATSQSLDRAHQVMPALYPARLRALQDAHQYVANRYGQYQMFTDPTE